MEEQWTSWRMHCKNRTSQPSCRKKQRSVYLTLHGDCSLGILDIWKWCSFYGISYSWAFSAFFLYEEMCVWLFHSTSFSLHGVCGVVVVGEYDCIACCCEGRIHLRLWLEEVHVNMKAIIVLGILYYLVILGMYILKGYRFP